MSPEPLLADFARALDQLEAALATPAEDDVRRAGCIQYFEFCFELAWKTIKAVGVRYGLADLHSPRGCLRQAWSQGWIEAETPWGASQFLAAALAAGVAAGFQPAVKPGFQPGGNSHPPTRGPWKVCVSAGLPAWLRGGWKPPSTAAKMAAATPHGAATGQRLQETGMHPTPWQKMLEARNLMAHTYDARRALTVYESLPGFLAELRRLHQVLSALPTK